MASKPIGMNRRALLAGIGAAALVPSGMRAARSQTFSTGNAELTVISDGAFSMPLGLMFPDAPQDALRAILLENGLPTDAIRPDCNVTMARLGDRLVVFDVGAGPNFLPGTGRLLEALGETGIDPDEVTDVVITHAHPDHLWGLTDDFDELVFANAAYHIGKEEWEFWSSPDTIHKIGEDRQTFVVGAQNRFAAIEGKVAFVKAGDEVLPGVEAVATPGHTPGHLSFMFHGAEPVLIVGDAISHAVVSFAHPAWPSASDQAPEQGAATRLSLLDRLAHDRARIIGFHFPQPGAGHVERRGDAYVYVPA